MDSSSHEVWDYNIAIAKDALKHGFDEVNFDYVRFPTDGAVSLLDYPNYEPAKASKSEVIRELL